MILAVDGGGTKTDAALFDDDGRELGRARAGPGNWWHGPAEAESALAAVWARLECDPSTVRACVGAAGLSAAGATARVRAALPAFAALHVVSDGYAALAGAFGARPGALIVVGTGVSGIARDGAGRVRQASGWGFPAGDRGGGAWLGFALVQAWLERLDGYPWPDSALWGEVAARAGERRASVLAWLRQAGPAAFAAFAPAVVAAGDEVAETLLTEAAAQIQNLASALVPQVSDGGAALQDRTLPELALSGGLAHVMAARLIGYRALLAPDPILGAARIARGEVSPVDPTLS